MLGNNPLSFDGTDWRKLCLCQTDTKEELKSPHLVIDQAHEQANAVVKGAGGAIGVTEDASALRRWMVSGPEVSQLVRQYELACQVKVAQGDTRHHEQTS